MSDKSATKRRGPLLWLSWIARVIFLPLSIAHSQDDNLPKIVDWLPIWVLFVAIPALSQQHWVPVSGWRGFYEFRP